MLQSVSQFVFILVLSLYDNFFIFISKQLIVILFEFKEDCCFDSDIRAILA